MQREDDDRAEVGGDVGDLRLGARLEEVVAEEADQREDQERTRARTDRAVVEADQYADPTRGDVVVTAVEAEIFSSFAPGELDTYRALMEKVLTGMRGSPDSGEE